MAILKWKIEYWSNEATGKSPVTTWLNKLTKEQFDTIFAIIRKLHTLGNQISLPDSKALGKGLFELRDKDFGIRVYYGFRGKMLIIVLAAGDKTSQDRDIKIARDRLSQIKKR